MQSNFGKWLKKRLREESMSQSALADRLEVSPACITQYVNGLTCPGVAMLVRICDQLDVEDVTEPARCIYFDEARRMIRKLSA
jgi:transcriptional regulator with XRE-family HTH domain